MSTLSRRLVRTAAVAVAAVLMAGSPVRALQATGPAVDPAAPVAPAALPGGGEALRVVVAEVTGTASVSTDEGKTWIKATPGMVVAQGAQFRTNLRSSVTCVIPPDQTFKLESLSTIRVAEAVKRGARARTDLIMKYGAASYGIERAGTEHESTIRTPGSTLAVRGTVVRVVDQAPFPPTAESFTGRAFFRTAQRQTALGGRGYSLVNSVQGSAAETALNQSVVDPAAARARTASEATLIADQVSRGALLTFDPVAQIPVVRNGPGPQTDAELANSLPGRLNFVLRWGGNADLNLLVTNQRANALDPNALSRFNPEEVLFPGYGLNANLTGGTIPFDDRGGPRGGQEVAFWQTSFPPGIFGVAPLAVRGAPTEFRLNAFLDGQPLPIFSFDASGNLVKFRTYTGTEPPADPANINSGIILIPTSPRLDQIPFSDPQAASAARRILASANGNRGNGANTGRSNPSRPQPVAAGAPRGLPPVGVAPPPSAGAGRPAAARGVRGPNRPAGLDRNAAARPNVPARSR